MKITKELIAQANYISRMAIDSIKRSALEVAFDHKRNERLDAGKCLTCFYLKRGAIAGQAITEWACGNCGQTSSHPNTNTPRYCLECSKDYRICVGCGADINLRTRLKVNKIHRRKARAPS